MPESAERRRLGGSHEDLAAWRRWGPYLSDRAWGTVREDYSADSEAWRYFPHDHARSKAYRWGEDGIAGFSDRYQILCWSLALWNGHDPILKERFFGVSHDEGNHGEDVKEYYFYVDALPSHAYQRMIYKYPHAEYPYAQLVEENGRRSSREPEFELIDTGVFDENRYFDVEVEIAKDDSETLYIRVRAHNRGPEAATIHLLPHLWFRNVWSWGEHRNAPPRINRTTCDAGRAALLADDSAAAPLHGLLRDTRVGPRLLEFSSDVRLLFTDNETNAERLYGARSLSAYTKDAFHRSIVNGEHDAVNPDEAGTKACGWLEEAVEPGEYAELSMRLSRAGSQPRFMRETADAIIETRRREADEFYESVHPPRATHEERNIQRQALAGLIWSKQSYLFDVDVWLDGDRRDLPPPSSRLGGRNARWRHLNSMRIMSMPDKWEYPWFAAWDLVFQAITFALIDADFAKEQIWLLMFEQFQHPNGQIPAYEWEFSDLNPPVQAWGAWRVYNMDRIRTGKPDRAFLEKCFHKLMLNFTWWVNMVDREGNNVFEGGFLGLDNITLVDRSRPIDGATLEQSDATGWMGMFCLVMMRIALELAREDQVYEGLATKFFEHYVYIGAAMKKKRDGHTLWDDDDDFFYDLLRYEDGHSTPFKVRSLVGLIPLYAVERLERNWTEPYPVFRENFEWFFRFRSSLVENCVFYTEHHDNPTHVLSVVDRDQLEKLLARVVDDQEFFGPFGIRSLSRYHADHPFVLDGAEVRYEPGESSNRIKGGNSNWRGPVWFPTSFLMIETLRKLEKAFGQVAIKTKGTSTLTLSNIARDLADRLVSIFVPDADGYRPANGPRGSRKSETFAHDPHWKDLVLFYEYFNGDHGEGLGASHQTGWTALVANLVDEWRR